MKNIRRILVVEDNEGVCELLQTLFDDAGCTIVVAGSAAAARRALVGERFDVALIDITLPGREDGFALAALAREAGCGVILLTGDVRHFHAVKTSGCHYLFKPFRIEHLLRLVGEVVEEPGAESKLIGQGDA